MTRLVLPAVLAIALSACGFHLRDAIQLPAGMGPVTVVARDAYSPLAESLSQALVHAGAPAAVAADTATVPARDVATLRILSERWGTTPLSVDAFGRAQEYTLRYAVIFTLEGADGAIVVPQQVIELSRDYISDPVRSLGTASEQELLANELRREMVAAILRRIDAASRAPAPASPPAP